MQLQRERFVSIVERASWAVLACLGTACGGETIVPPAADANPTYDPCTDSSSLETLMIADFEAAPAVNFFTSNDGTAASIAPETTGLMPVELEAPKCAGVAEAGSAYHVSAVGLQGYGLSFGFNNLGILPGGDGLPYFDATTWSGISLWVRKGSADAASSFFAAVAERFTDPSGAALFPEAEQDALLEPGLCPDAMGSSCYCAFSAMDVNGDGSPDPLESQCDRFGAGVGVDVEWRFFKIPFSRMRQRAYGRPSLLVGPEPKIVGFDFGLRGALLDFWIDELAFYREPAEDPATE